MEEITTVGIDLAKDVLAVCVLDACGAVLERKVLRRAAFERWAAALAPCSVAMEACAVRIIGVASLPPAAIPPG